MFQSYPPKIGSVSDSVTMPCLLFFLCGRAYVCTNVRFYVFAKACVCVCVEREREKMRDTVCRCLHREHASLFLFSNVWIGSEHPASICHTVDV